MTNQPKLPEEVQRQWREIRDDGPDTQTMKEFYDRIESFLAGQLAKEREKIVKELEDIETKNHDKELDTLDFDSFAEDVCIWLQRNKTHD